MRAICLFAAASALLLAAPAAACPWGGSGTHAAPSTGWGSDFASDPTAFYTAIASAPSLIAMPPPPTEEQRAEALQSVRGELLERFNLRRPNRGPTDDGERVAVAEEPDTPATPVARIGKHGS